MNRKPYLHHAIVRFFAFACFLVLSISILFAGTLIVLAAFSWSDSTPDNNTSATWMAVASDADGSVLVAAAWPGRLSISTNSGATWTERQPAGNADQNWSAVATDSDGSHMIAAAFDGRLYTSANGGSTWTERQPAGNAEQSWAAVGSDADGSFLVAMSFVFPARIYVSEDSGATWIERRPAGDMDLSWQSISVSSDGSRLAAVVAGGRVYTSTDGGATWIERQPAGNADKNWARIAGDETGLRLLVADGPGRLYTSTNGGATWTERQPAGNADRQWSALASDAQGATLLAAVSVGRLYLSRDSGATWVETRPAGNNDKTWAFAATDADGDRYIIGVDGGSVYVGALVSLTAPTNVTVTNVSTTSMDITWSDQSSDEVGFLVERSIDGGVFTVVTTTLANITSVTGDTLAPNTAYWFRVAATSTDTGASAYATTSAATYTLASVPSSVALRADTQSQITVSFTGDATDYQVENVTVEDSSGWISATSHAFTVGLKCGTTYAFRIKGRGAASIETAWTENVEGATVDCARGGSGQGGEGLGAIVDVSVPVVSSPAPASGSSVVPEPNAASGPVPEPLPVFSAPSSSTASPTFLQPLVPTVPVPPSVATSVSSPIPQALPPSPPYVFRTTLSLGSRGEAVKQLQKALLRLDLYHGPIHGWFDFATRRAVIAFQKQKKIVPASGIVGILTRKALNEVRAR